MPGADAADAPEEVVVHFTPAGGPLTVELTCGHAQFGTYTLREWTPDGMTVVKKGRGSFLDEIEDVYPLLSPPGANDEHILQCRARVWLVQGTKRYSVFMTVKQGGDVIGETFAEDTTDASTVTVELRIRLRET